MAKHQPSTQVDSRRFTYPLAALKTKYQWMLAKAEARLSKARVTLARRRSDLENAQTQRASHLQWTHGCELMLTNLGLRRQAIAHLVWLDAQIDELWTVVVQAGQSCKTCAGACEALRLKLDLLDDHHRLQLTDFQQEELRTAYAEQDRDWMTRRAHGTAVDAAQSIECVRNWRPHEHHC